jgi:hypothetical protein
MQRSNLTKDLEKVLLRFPKLQIEEMNKKTCLKGEIDIFDPQGTYWDSYNIKIAVPYGYPYAFPELFETTNKFPHIADRHANPQGNCCLCSLQEEDITSQKGISIYGFIEKYVIPYLANQTYFDLTGSWANGEYAHGYYGVLQYYQELLEIENLQDVYELLTVLKKSNIQRNDNCYCGSERKIKHCHLKQYTTFKNISLKRLESDVRAIGSLIEIEQLKNITQDQNAI